MKCSEFTVDLEADPLKDPGTYGGAATNRKCTDLIALIVTLLFLILVTCPTVYCILNSDVDKYVKGYDDCGNICGRNNTKTQSIPFECFGKNMLGTSRIKFAYDPISGAQRICIKNCHPFGSIYCWQTGSDTSLMPLHNYIVQMIAFIIGFAIIGLIAITCIQCCILNKSEFRIPLLNCHFLEIAFFVAVLLAAIILFSDYQRNFYFGFYVFMIILAVISIPYFIFICPFYRSNRMGVKIGLTVDLNKETSKIIKDLDFTCVLPLVNIIIISLLFYGWSWCNVYISTYSYLDEVDETIMDEKIYDYILYPITIVTKILLICTVLFLYEFIRNVQFMLISGTVAQWYFTRNKTDLSSPFTKTLINVIKYHFGTLFFCSFILTLTIPIQILVNLLSFIFSITTYKQTKLKFFRQNLSENRFRILSGVLTCLTRNGLIMTAIHGLHFSAATLRASKLLAQNQFNVSTVFNFGDWIFIVVKFTASCCILYLAFVIVLFWPPFFSIYYLVMTLIAVIWICVFYDSCCSAKSVTQYTLFLCFCEDCLYNNGTTKPYYMTPELAKFIESANVFVDGDNWKKIEDKWSQGPKKLY